MKKSLKNLFGVFVAAIVILGLPISVYLKGVPFLVKSIFFKNIVQESVSKYAGYDLIVDGLEFLPSIKPNVTVKVDELLLSKDNVKVLYLKNTKVKFSFRKILNKQLRIKGIYADEISINLNGFPKSDKPAKKQGMQIDFVYAGIDIKALSAEGNIGEGVNFSLNGNDLLSKRQSLKQRILKFNINAIISRNNDRISIIVKDNDKAYIRKKTLIVENLPVIVNGSAIKTTVLYQDNKRCPVVFVSDSFDAGTAYKLVKIIIPENEALENFNGVSGKFSFRFKLDGKNSDGNIGLKLIRFNLVPAENMPFEINNGIIKFSKDLFEISNLKGFYENKSQNKFDLNGIIKPKFADLTGNAVVTDDFVKNYLSKKFGYPLGMKGSADTRIVFRLKDKNADILWLYKFTPGCGFIIDGEDFGSTESERVLVSKMKVDPYYLDITSLDYFVGSPEDKDFNKKPILSFYGKVNLKNNCRLMNFGFKIPEYLTSKFFNLLFREDLFRRGKIKGAIEYVNTGAYPSLNGHLSVEKTGMPSQGLFIRNALFKADGNTVRITSDGKYKTSEYKISADILNRVLFPIIVKNINLTVDNVDVEKFITSVNGSSVPEDRQTEDENIKETDLSAVIVEKGNLNLVKGVYKTIGFNNVLADFSYDKNQVLRIDSNKFGFAEGKSSTNIICNLKDKLYSVKLNVEDVNSDAIAYSILGLRKEISGKADGTIELNADKSLKLNGSMDFKIKDGIISKIGLFEYILKFTTILRNPIVTVSPSMVFDIVNMPKGGFDVINGSLKIKDNVIHRISISSSSPQISSYIAGKYDIEHNDSALRIYIKFGSKARGLYGLIKNISLGGLANKTPFGAKTSNNYYEREIEKIPPIDESAEKDSKIYLVKVDGDIVNNNFISFLKKLK